MKKFWKVFLRIVLILFVLINIITAFHAYKFTHFYDAGEAAPQNKAKAMFLGINAFKKPNDAADSGTQTVILTTSDQLKLEGWYNTVDSAKGTVCLFHGHGGRKSDVTKEAEGFRKMGYNTFQLDFRAHGASQGNTCTIGYYESEDVKLAYDFVKSKGEKNIVLWGISMGGAAVIKAIKDYPLKPNKMIVEMPFGSVVEAAEGRIRLMGLPGEPLARLITFWGGVEHGFWAYGMKPKEFAKEIQCPVLLQWGKNDPRVSKKEIDDIYGNIATQKKLVVYDSCGHESLCKKEKEKWFTEVNDFLK